VADRLDARLGERGGGFRWFLQRSGPRGIRLAISGRLDACLGQRSGGGARLLLRGIVSGCIWLAMPERLVA